MHEMQPKVTIRKATRDDADTLFTLLDALADYEKLARQTPEARKRFVRDGFGPNPRLEVFIGELSDRPVAYAMIFETYSSFAARPTLYLEDLFVLEEARGSGVGSALFDHCRAEAARRGCARMEWVVLDWNRPAIDFYHKRGARHLKEWYTYRLTEEQLRV